MSPMLIVVFVDRDIENRETCLLIGLHAMKK